MKKSTLLATAVLAGAIAQPAFAQDSNPDYFNGVYVGGTLSVESIDDGKDEGLAFDTDGDGEYNDVVRTITVQMRSRPVCATVGRMPVRLRRPAATTNRNWATPSRSVWTVASATCS